MKIKMQVTKKEAAMIVAKEIRDYYTGSASSMTIGINLNGMIDRWRHVHGLDGLAVALYETTTGWTLGYFNGDIYSDDDWANNLEANAQAFEAVWIDQAINDQDKHEIEWPNK